MIPEIQLKTGETIEVIVVCNSKTQEITKIEESKYKIRLKSQPIDGKANKELEKFFKSLGYLVDILKGHKSNQKIIKIR